jgi:transposase
VTQPMTNELASKVVEVYGQTLKRMRDGTHFEHCWQDHWSCALDMCLAEIERLEYLKGLLSEECKRQFEVIHGRKFGEGDVGAGPIEKYK